MQYGYNYLPGDYNLISLSFLKIDYALTLMWNICQSWLNQIGKILQYNYFFFNFI